MDQIDLSDILATSSTAAATSTKSHNGVQSVPHTSHSTHIPGNPELDAVETTDEYKQFIT